MPILKGPLSVCALFSVCALAVTAALCDAAAAQQTAIATGACGVAINASGTATVIVNNEGCSKEIAQKVQALLDKSLEQMEMKNLRQDRDIYRISELVKSLTKFVVESIEGSSVSEDLFRVTKARALEQVAIAKEAGVPESCKRGWDRISALKNIAASDEEKGRIESAHSGYRDLLGMAMQVQGEIMTLEGMRRSKEYNDAVRRQAEEKRMQTNDMIAAARRQARQNNYRLRKSDYEHARDFTLELLARRRVAVDLSEQDVHMERSAELAVQQKFQDAEQEVVRALEKLNALRKRHQMIEVPIFERAPVFPTEVSSPPVEIDMRGLERIPGGIC